jgi:hypothetical protein
MPNVTTIDRQPCSWFLDHQLAQSLLGVRGQRTTVIGNVEVHRGARLLLREPLDYVHQRDQPVGLLCQIERKSQGLRSGRLRQRCLTGDDARRRSPMRRRPPVVPARRHPSEETAERLAASKKGTSLPSQTFEFYRSRRRPDPSGINSGTTWQTNNLLTSSVASRVP